MDFGDIATNLLLTHRTWHYRQGDRHGVPLVGCCHSGHNGCDNSGTGYLQGAQEFGLRRETKRLDILKGQKAKRCLVLKELIKRTIIQL